MALLKIRHYPDPVLKKVAEPVTEFDDSLRQLAHDMAETMYAAPGIGLAATQVNMHIRLVVMDLSEDNSEPLVFINPEFTTLTDQLEQYQEGCLSVPEIYADVDRPATCRVRYQDLDGKVHEEQLDGLMATCIQRMSPIRSRTTLT